MSTSHMSSAGTPSTQVNGAAPARPSAVHVRFSPSAGRRLQRSEPTTCGDGRPLWTERPLLMKRADGTYELIGTSRNLEGLARWILSFGPDAEVRSPDRLRQRTVAEARRIVKLYRTEAP